MNGPDKPRSEVIGNLVADLSPVHHPGRTHARALAWLTGTAIVITGLMLVRAPFRPGFAEQLLAHPRFALESALGAAAIASLALAAFHRVLPAVRAPWLRTGVPLVATAAWIGLTIYGLTDPALAPSMAGKRPHCFLEVLFLGLPALAAGILILRTYFPLQGVRCGFLLGLTAGAIPALLMQFACMYLVPHMLQFHFLPGFALAGLGALAGYAFLRAP